MNNKISIITTTYNHENFIANTIESILWQDHKDWELLIGDDSPNNKTWEIIKWYTKKFPDKIKAWHHKPNKWIVENINFLISCVASDSKYIAFLEWDDLYDVNNLSDKLAIFQEYPKVRIVYSDMDFIDDKWKTIISNYLKYRRIQFYKDEQINANIFIKQTTWPICSRSTWMIDKSVLIDCKIRSLDEKKKNYQISDYDFYFQIATQHNVYGIEKPLTKYRRHGNNLSWSNGWTSQDLETLIKYYFSIWLLDHKSYNNKMSWIQIVYAFFCIENWDKRNWIKHIIKAFNYSWNTYLIYKIFLCFLYLLPEFIWKKIIKKIVWRN